MSFIPKAFLVLFSLYFFPITQASSNLIANEISYRADQEIKIEALANTQSSKNYNASFSFGSNGGGGLSGGGGKDTYALTRGKTAENIFALKNYANTNTNTLTNTEWNTKYQSSKVFKQGNQLNKETWQRNAEGIGERDNARIKRRPLHKGIYLPMSDTKIFGKENLKLQHQHIFFEDEKGGNIGFFPDGVHADSDRHLHTYEDVDGKYYDDKMMREAIKRTIPQMQNYNLLQNNCQDFIQKVLQEYHFIEATK